MGVDWEKQPRNPETGQWELRGRADRRDRWLKIRITSDDLETIYQAAAGHGMTVTAYVVACCKADLPGSRARTAADMGSPMLKHQKRLAARLHRRGY